MPEASRPLWRSYSRCAEACLSFLHRDAKWRILEPEKHGAFLDERIVMDINLTHPPSNVAADHGLGSLNVGVVGRLIASAGEIEVERAREHDEWRDEHERQAQPLAGRSRADRRGGGGG